MTLGAAGLNPAERANFCTRSSAVRASVFSGERKVAVFESCRVRQFDYEYQSGIIVNSIRRVAQSGSVNVACVIGHDQVRDSGEEA